jgi:tetratricopeptide (TPR) repeat protein
MQASEESARALARAESEASRARVAESARLVEALAAQREARTAKATKDFLVKLFETNSLDQAAAAKKRALPIETLLKQAVAELPAQFSAQPALRAELLGVVGGLLRDLHLNRDAIAAMNIRIAALKSLSPAPATDIFSTRFAIAAALYDAGDVAEAKSQLIALDKELESSRDPKLQRIRANANGTLSHLYSSAYERALALTHGKRAVELSDTSNADAESKIDNLQHYAYSLDVNEQIDASREAYRRAIQLAESASGRDSIKAAQTQLTFGESLVAQSAPRLAIPHLRRAIEVGAPKWGEDSFWAARAYEALGRSLSNVGEFEEAQAAYAKSQIGVDNNSAHIPVDTVIRNRLRYVDHLLNYGDPAAAQAILDKLPTLPAGSGVGRVLLPLTQGRALMDNGAYHASLQHFKKFSRELATLWPLDSAEHAHILLRIALNQSLLSQFTEANAICDGVLQRFPDLTGPLGKVQHVALAQKALNAYLAGDAAAAVELSKPLVALAIAQPVDQRRPNNTHILLLRHVIYLKAQGRCKEALPMLKTTSEIASKFSKNSMLRAQSIAIHRECLVATSETQAAANLPQALPIAALSQGTTPKHFQIGVAAVAKPSQ